MGGIPEPTDAEPRRASLTVRGRSLTVLLLACASVCAFLWLCARVVVAADIEDPQPRDDARHSAAVDARYGGGGARETTWRTLRCLIADAVDGWWWFCEQVERSRWPLWHTVSRRVV